VIHCQQEAADGNSDGHYFYLKQQTNKTVAACLVAHRVYPGSTHPQYSNTTQTCPFTYSCPYKSIIMPENSNMCQILTSVSAKT
jgi:hypothetical protein